MINKIAKLLIPKFVKATVASIIIKNNKILLEKRSPFLPEHGKWCLPGGHIGSGEKAETAIKREIKEELGLTTNSPEFLGYFDEIIPDIGVYAVVLVFKARVEGKIKLQRIEVSKYDWFTRKELKKLSMAFHHREIIEKFWEKK
ncbi:MAG: NUDIX hydrolase [Nanoarchaeota archaeon]|nr:NUDIX hydrolase [Nanoarchaeota archaeon]MBU0977891.1 NUDIX hydrolase [Nanoarchaeota archaeon]